MQRSVNEPVTSSSLLMRIRDPNDSDSWQRFVAIYTPIIRSYCRRRGFQSTDTDDIAQNVLVSISRSIENFQYDPARGKFRAWLAAVTANKMKDFSSKSTLDQERLNGYLDQLTETTDSDPQWTELFMQQVFKAAKEKVQADVEENTWNCFQKIWVENRPATEVAEQLQIPIHSVYVNKSRVLKRLETEFLMLSDEYPFSQPD